MKRASKGFRRSRAAAAGKIIDEAPYSFADGVFSFIFIRGNVHAYMRVSEGVKKEQISCATRKGKRKGRGTGTFVPIVINCELSPTIGTVYYYGRVWRGC